MKLPLSPDTRSGGLIYSIESEFRDRLSFYKTNLVKCLPLNSKTGKIRYPLKKEMQKCFQNFEVEIEVLKPSIIFLLGKQVSDFVLSRYMFKEYRLDNNFKYESYRLENVELIPVHHPSYILVYKRRFIKNYISGISEHLESFYELSES